MTLPKDNTAVLFTDGRAKENERETYHLMTCDEKFIRDVIQERHNPGLMLAQLYNVLCKQNVFACAVYPGSPLYEHTTQEDIDGLEKYDVRTPGQVIHTAGHTGKMGTLKLAGRAGPVRFVLFPEQEEWDIPGPEVMLHTYEYIRVAVGSPLLYREGTLGMQILRDLHYQHNVIIRPLTFPDVYTEQQWEEIYTHAVFPYDWHKVDRETKTHGLSSTDKKKKWVYGFDKNGQYAGASMWLDVGNGPFDEVTDLARWRDYPVAFWKINVTDVSHTEWNGYELPCPLYQKGKQWACTELLRFADRVGIAFDIERGIYWKPGEIVKPQRPLARYAKFMWDARQKLKDTSAFPDRIAARNAEISVKNAVNSSFGRFAKKHNGLYYHPDWGVAIKQRAMANMAFSLHKRVVEHNIRPKFVVTDSFYILSDEDTPEKAYPGILEREHDISGYKLIGRCELTPEIITLFEKRNTVELQRAIKSEMRKAGVHV